MKKTMFLTFLGSAALLAACSQDVVIEGEEPLTQERAIGFKPLTEKMGTRAASYTTASLQDTTFKVFTFYDADGIYPATPDRVAYKPVSTAKYANGAWTTDPVLYWPMSGTGKMEFVAYAPGGTTYGSVSGYANPNDVQSANLTLEYTVPSDITKQEDLLVACTAPIAVPPANNPGTVAIHFKHALSRVTVKAKSNVTGKTYDISEVRLLNVMDKGKLELDTLHVTPVVTGAVQWRDTSGQTTYTKTFATSVTVDGDGYKDVLVNDDAFMVMPHTATLGTSTNPLDDPASTDKGLYLYVKAGGKNYYIPLSDPTDKSKPFTFAMGRQYNFLLTIMLNQIDYDTEVLPYDEEDDNF